MFRDSIMFKASVKYWCIVLKEERSSVYNKECSEWSSGSLFTEALKDKKWWKKLVRNNIPSWNCYGLSWAQKMCTRLSWAQDGWLKFCLRKKEKTTGTSLTFLRQYDKNVNGVLDHHEAADETRDS